MKVATLILRWIFGLFYVYVGAAWFTFLILGKPWVEPETHEAAKAFAAALTASGFADPLVSVTCLVGGSLLLVGRTAPLGIVVLAPLVTVIFLFHLFLSHAWPWGTANLAVLLLLAWQYRRAYRPLVGLA